MSAMKFISGFKLQPPAILFLRVIAGLLIATGLTLFLTAPKRVKSPENPPPPPIAAADQKTEVVPEMEIEAENPVRPLSDAKLAAMLKTDGITVARRTVAKYREAMNIPSSNERQRHG